MIEDVVKVFVVFIVIGLPTLLIFGRPYFNRLLDIREKQMEVEARLAAEKAAQYATSNSELEARLRVLEQIVTDGGLETAAQIEALRKPRLTAGDKVR
ncbi:MAG: hypothetical protein ACJ8E8_07720 [Sphingomicrobium sp.]